MHWHHFNVESPSSGNTYIVSRVSSNGRSTGLYTFYYMGDKFYWRSDNGNLFECNRNDLFCDIDDVIAYVEDKIIDDIEFELHSMRCRY